MHFTFIGRSLGVVDLWPDLLSMLNISWVFDTLRDAFVKLASTELRNTY